MKVCSLQLFSFWLGQCGSQPDVNSACFCFSWDSQQFICLMRQMTQWANSRQFLELLAWEAVKFCVAWLLSRVIRHRRILLFGSCPTSTKKKRIVRSTNESNSPTSKIDVERSNESSLCFLWSSSPNFVLYTCMVVWYPRNI